MYKIKYDANKDSGHGRVLNAVNERVMFSEKEMADNYNRYRENEKKYLLYKKQKKKESECEDGYKEVSIPASYSMLLTAHTYWVNVFLNKPLVFQVSGSDGSGVKKEQAMEAMLNYQVTRGKMLPNMVVWLLDVGRYGIGIVGDYWDTEYVMHSEVVEEETEEDGIPTGEFVKRIKRKKVEKYRGSKLYNVLPYDFLPDPRVPFNNIQAGEFCGRKTVMSWNDIKKGEADGRYFNVKEAENIVANARKRNEDRFDPEGLNQGPEVSGVTYAGGKSKKQVSFVNVVEMFIEIIPRDWDLGDSEYPEKWMFTVVDGKVVIGATPLGLYHNKFPFHVLECEVDGYKQASRGLLEVGKELNDILDWLFNSHMYNKRAVMNNQFVYDPSRVVERDLTRKDPGKMIRLKPLAYGTDVRQAISQLPVADVSAQNIQDSALVESQMQRVTGINEDMAGVSQGSSRRSAAEFRGTTSFSAQRLANIAYYFGITGFSTLGECLISNTQQLYTTELKVKVAGDTIIDGESLTVNPEDIAGQFDIVAVEGTQPVDRMAQAQFWQNAMATALSIPGLAEQYRLPELFEYVAKLGGLKGISKFKMQQLSDADLLALVREWQQGGGRGQSGKQAAGVAGAEGISGGLDGAAGVDSAVQSITGT